MTRHITRFRALLAANVLLVILSFALIAPQWLEDDDRFDFEGITIVGPDSADMEAAIAQLRKHPRVLVTPATPASPTVAVKPVKRPKPPIAGPDLMTGRRVALSQFRGKPVFVIVWASWNVGSLAQASTLGRFARSHAGRVAVLGIDSEDSERAARAFSKRYAMDFPSIADPVGILAAAWSPVPTTLVFDRRHVLVEKIAGSVSVEQLNAALRHVTRR